MFLSLFLLLLAFFILLTAISTLEETKSRDVLSSLAATFKNDIVPDNTAEILVSTLGPVPEPEDVIEDLERLWLTAVPIAQVDALTRGRTLQISLPQTEVFVGGQPTVRADRADLLQATAYALAARLEGFSAQLHFSIPVDALDDVVLTQSSLNGAAAQNDTDLVDPDTSDVATAEAEVYEPEQLPFLRSARFAGALVDAGAPPDGITVGVAERRTEKLRLRFEILDETRAHVTFTAAVESGQENGSGTELAQ